MCASRRRKKWILGNVQNNYRDRLRKSSGKECLAIGPATAKANVRTFENDVAQNEGDGWLSKDAVDC